MTQQVYDPIDPVPTSGVILAALLNGLRLSILSGNSGNSRPSYAQAGTAWFNTAASPWVYNIFDGSHDLPLFDLNPTTGVMRLYHAGSVLGALALKDSIGSGDIGNGAVLTAALGAKAVTQAKLGDASVGALQIKASEKADILAALLGSAVNGKVVKGNGTTFEIALPQVSVASDDNAPGYLGAKLVGGSLFTVEVFSDAGEKKVRVKLSDGTPNYYLGFDGTGKPAVLPPPSNGVIVSRVVFTSSGTYTKPADLLYIDVEVQGGGGGGGGAIASGGNFAGGTGGTSSFGSHCSSTGGTGGGGGSSSGGGTGGTPGTGVSGDFNAYGGYGSMGYKGAGTADTSVGGHGGSSYMGGGGRVGAAGIAPGSGGSGASAVTLSGTAGGSGAGGGAGGYSRKIIANSSLGATETVNIGGGGAASTSSTGGTAGAAGVIIVTEYRRA